MNVSDALLGVPCMLTTCVGYGFLKVSSLHLTYNGLFYEFVTFQA